MGLWFGNMVVVLAAGTGTLRAEETGMLQASHKPILDRHVLNSTGLCSAEAYGRKPSQKLGYFEMSKLENQLGDEVLQFM